MSREQKEPLEIRIKYHDPELPRLAKLAVGDWIDLRAAETVHLKAGEARRISLGVSMQLPAGYEAHVLPRSGTFGKWEVTQTNSMGVIDGAYCGNNDVWMLPVLARRDTTIEKGDRICQFRIMKKMPEVRFIEVDSLGNGDRGGFGSTGTK